MKIFHLSDLHIGKQLYGYSLKEDQQYALNEIVNKVREEMPDVIIIAGDIYDKSVPSAEAVTLFDWFLTELSNISVAISVLIISGNHDSPERLDFASHILEKHNIHVCGMPPISKEEYLKKVTLEDEYGEVNFYMLPFIKPGYVRGILDEPAESYNTAVSRIIERENIDYSGRNVLITHQFYTSAGSKTQRSDSEMITVGGIDNVDIEAVKDFDYVAMGHIHKAQRVGSDNIRYSGALLKYSVSEQNSEKILLKVELTQKGEQPDIKELPLKQLRDVRLLKGTLKELLEPSEISANKDDYVSIILTDEEELYKPLDKLQNVYSHILELRLDNTRTRNILEDSDNIEKITNPLEAFEQFFEKMQGRAMSEEEQVIMTDIINKLGGTEQ